MGAESIADTMNFSLLPSEVKIDFINQVAAKSNHKLPEQIIEKDWWVTQVLKAVFSLPYAEHLSFKGGTSLSKCWHLIERFSEDIDIAINRDFLGYGGELSRTQISDKLRRATCSFVREKMQFDVKNALVALGIKPDAFKVQVNITSVTTTDPETIAIAYQSVLPESPYIRHCVLLEVSGRSMQHPIKVESLQSFVDQYLTESVVAQPAFSIPNVVVPERTFLEKIFLLHEEFTKPPTAMRTARMSRHLYDVYCLQKKGIAERALHDEPLYRTIINHRRQFINLKSFDYSTLFPATLSIIPPAQVMEAWRDDYEDMLLNMIYDTEAPDFDTLITVMKELQNTIKTLPYKSI